VGCGTAIAQKILNERSASQTKHAIYQAVSAIIAHPLALQVNKVSIFIYSIAFSTIPSIEAVPTNEYAAALPSVTAFRFSFLLIFCPPDEGAGGARRL
jgi:hypothetical protein